MDWSTSAPQDRDFSAEEGAENLRIFTEQWYELGFGEIPEDGVVEGGCYEVDDGDEDQADIGRQIGIDEAGEKASAREAVADQVADGEETELEAGLGVDRGEPLEDVEVERDDFIVLDSSDAGENEVPRRERAVSCSTCHVASRRTYLFTHPSAVRTTTTPQDPGLKLKDCPPESSGRPS